MDSNNTYDHHKLKDIIDTAENLEENIRGLHDQLLITLSSMDDLRHKGTAMQRSLLQTKNLSEETNAMIKELGRIMRGFQEQEFSSPQFQVASLEMGYQATGSVQTKLFIDIGSDRLNILATNWIGYGVGLSQVNKHSIIRVDYALSNHSISKGKLHIKWISRL